MRHSMRTNIAIGIAAILLSAALMLMSNTAASLAIVLVAVFVPILSIVLGRLTAKRTRISFGLGKSCVVDQSLALEMQVERYVFWRGRIELMLECRNVMTGGVERTPVVLLPAAGKVEHFSLPVNTTCCGVVEISLVEAVSFDPLGFVRAPIPEATLSSSYVVYPTLFDLEARVNQSSHPDILGAEYDRNKKGQDATEVFDTREFRAGDSLKRVHWKLSARLEDLIVREPSRPADCDVALVVGIEVGEQGDPGRIPVIDSTLSLAASVSLSLLRQGIVHDVAHAEGDTLAFDSIDSRPSFDGMLDVLMATAYPRRARSETLAALIDQWSSSRMVAKTVMVTNFISEEAFERLAVITNLTVVYVGSDTGLGVSSNDKYPIVHVDAASVGASVKSLEL